jgi:hypothetical protein
MNESVNNPPPEEARQLSDEPPDTGTLPGAAYPTEPRAPMQSFKAEFIADNSGKWCGNEPRFATRPEAEGYAKSLSLRWILVREHRVIESEDPVNAKFVNGRSVPLAPPETRPDSPSRDCTS